MDHPQLSIEKPKSSILKIICSNANIVIIVLYECWFIIDIIVIIVSAGEYLQIYFTSVYEVCSKSNLNMEIKQKQLKLESHLLFNFSWHSCLRCENTFSFAHIIA